MRITLARFPVGIDALRGETPTKPLKSTNVSASPKRLPQQVPVTEPHTRAPSRMDKPLSRFRDLQRLPSAKLSSER